jgi:hypothetical protein
MVFAAGFRASAEMPQRRSNWQWCAKATTVPRGVNKQRTRAKPSPALDFAPLTLTPQQEGLK